MAKMRFLPHVDGREPQVWSGVGCVALAVMAGVVPALTWDPPLPLSRREEGHWEGLGGSGPAPRPWGFLGAVRGPLGAGGLGETRVQMRPPCVGQARVKSAGECWELGDPEFPGKGQQLLGEVIL